MYCYCMFLTQFLAAGLSVESGQISALSNFRHCLACKERSKDRSPALERLWDGRINFLTCQKFWHSDAGSHTVEAESRVHSLTLVPSFSHCACAKWHTEHLIMPWQDDDGQKIWGPGWSSCSNNIRASLMMPPLPIRKCWQEMAAHC